MNSTTKGRPVKYKNIKTGGTSMFSLLTSLRQVELTIINFFAELLPFPSIFTSTSSLPEDENL